MSMIVKIILCGWTAEFALIGFCALNESGKLLLLHERLGHWLRALAPPSVINASVSQGRSGEGELVA